MTWLKTPKPEDLGELIVREATEHTAQLLSAKALVKVNIANISLLKLAIMRAGCIPRLASQAQLSTVKNTALPAMPLVNVNRYAQLQAPLHISYALCLPENRFDSVRHA